MWKVLFLVLSIFLTFSNCANILGVFPLEFYSHLKFQKSLMVPLLDRGHNVTIITEKSFNLNHPNFTEILFGSGWKHEFDAVGHKLNIFKFFDNLFAYFRSIAKMDRLMGRLAEILVELKREKFDVLVFEGFFFTPFMVLAEIFDCPIIASYAMPAYILSQETMGNDINPITSPDPCFVDYDVSQTTLLQRFEAVVKSFGVLWITKPIHNVLNFISMKKHFPSVKTSIEQIEDRIELLIERKIPAFGLSKPTTNTIYLNFMHMEKPKEIQNKELKKFLDNSENGVVYINFGTIVNTRDLPVEIVEKFLSTFRNLKQGVLWKFYTESLDNKTENIFLSKDLPQPDILAHPNVKLFITHGGDASIEEAIDREVPMVVFPMFTDQNFNAGAIQRKKLGISLDLRDFTSESLTAAITEMQLPKYKENIKKFREVVYDEPMTSHEKAVWWVEYVIRHKKENHLRFPGRKVPFYQKYLLDLFASVFFVLFIMSKIYSFQTKIFY